MPPDLIIRLALHHDERGHEAQLSGLDAPDFTRLTCAAACRRVAQLIATGMAESNVADLVGWSVNDIRRVLSERVRCSD